MEIKCNSKSKLNNINCVYILKDILKYIKKIRSYKILNYNTLLKRLSINPEDFKKMHIFVYLKNRYDFEIDIDEKKFILMGKAIQDLDFFEDIELNEFEEFNLSYNSLTDITKLKQLRLNQLLFF